jgi:adenylosuccinate synthase
MPVSIVVGGQFGSEGKGKVSLELVRRSQSWNFPTTVVRVGGPNSGHTAYDRSGKKWALRQMPAGCVDRDVDVVFPSGSYIDVPLLLKEIEQLNYPTERIFISKWARIITAEHKAWESDAGLVGAIGSTGSGVGGAVMASVAREASNFPIRSLDADHSSPLQDFVCDTSDFMRRRLQLNCRVIIEGTQGFGLSLLEGGLWPKATARSTTASAALAEAGLSPMDVDDVTVVLRTFPIRVAGNSGKLPKETTWERVATSAGDARDLREYTTVTNKLRRVGEFDAEIVRRAISVNNPSRLVLNHLDYVGSADQVGQAASKVELFVADVEQQISQRIDWYGFSGLGVVEREGLIA